MHSFLEEMWVKVQFFSIFVAVLGFLTLRKIAPNTNTIPKPNPNPNQEQYLSGVIVWLLPPPNLKTNPDLDLGIFLWGVIVQIPLVADEIFKSIFVKRGLLRFYYFINIYITYRNRSFILMKFLLFDFNITKFYDCFFHSYI